MTLGELFGDEIEAKILSSVPAKIDKESLSPELCKEILKMALSG